MVIIKDYICAIVALSVLLGLYFASKHLDFTRDQALESQQRRFIYLCEKYGEVRISSGRIIKCEVIADDAIKQL